MMRIVEEKNPVMFIIMYKGKQYVVYTDGEINCKDKNDYVIPKKVYNIRDKFFDEI